MSDEKNESRINIENLPQAEQELTSEEASQVQGGLLPAVLTGNSDGATARKKGDGIYNATIEVESFSWS